MPGRDRLPAAAALRHRTGRAAVGYLRVALGTLVERARVPPGKGSFGGRLVGPPAARGTAALRGARRRGADRASRRLADNSRRRARPSGPARSSRPCSPPGRRRGLTRGGAHRDPPRAVPPRARRGARALDRQGQDRPGRGPVAAPCLARHSDRRGGQVVPRQSCSAVQAQRVFRPSRPATRERVAGRGGAGAGQRRRRAARDGPRSYPTGRRRPTAGPSATPPPRPAWWRRARWWRR